MHIVPKISENNLGTNKINIRYAFIKQMEVTMLGWAVTFFVIAIIAAVLGFGGIAGASAGIAQILFFIFLVLFVATLVMRAVRSAT